MSCEDLGAQLLAAHPTVATFCESCGDRVPGMPFVYDSGSFELTTTYIKTSADRFDNLAALAGCPTAGEAQSLRIEHDHGDLIVPEHVAGMAVQGRVVVVEDASPPYGLVACLSMTGTLAVILAARAVARRRAHRPRL